MSPDQLMKGKIEDADWGSADLEDMIGGSPGFDSPVPQKPRSFTTGMKKRRSSGKKNRRRSLHTDSYEKPEESKENASHGPLEIDVVINVPGVYDVANEKRSKSKSRRSSSTGRNRRSSTDGRRQRASSTGRLKSRRKHRSSRGSESSSGSSSAAGPIVGQKYHGSIVSDLKEEVVNVEEARVRKRYIITFEDGMVMKEDFYQDMFTKS